MGAIKSVLLRPSVKSVQSVADFLFSRFSPLFLLLRYAKMFVIHRDIVRPLFRDVIFREDGSHGASRFASPTIDAFFWMDIKHRGRFELGFFRLVVDAIQRA